jgi:type IV secretory pathway VirB3-like protein
MKDAIFAILSRPRDVIGVPSKRKCFNALVLGAENSGKT